MDIQKRFDDEMLAIYWSVGKATGYWAGYYLRGVRQNGGLAYAKKALSKTDQPQDGFLKLIEVGRPDLSLEALVTKAEFRSLFTAQEINEAQKRLDSVPNFAWRKSVDPVENFSGEISDEDIFVEGATRKVTVNTFERSRQARLACLNKYGCQCIVCGMKFEAVYGEIGKNFIHVHHLKPLAGTTGKYELNPIKDLVPVCPNCHAMLHSSEPPLTIEELKSQMKAPSI